MQMLNSILLLFMLSSAQAQVLGEACYQSGEWTECKRISNPVVVIDNDWNVTKVNTNKYSLVDKIAVQLCEATRKDCDADTRCSKDGIMMNCTLQVYPSYVWYRYRDVAKKMLDSNKEEILNVK